MNAAKNRLSPVRRKRSDSPNRRTEINAKRRIRVAMAVVVGFVVSMAPLRALIERKYPLKEVLRECHFIVEAKVVRLDAGKKRVVVEVQRDLKGKLPFRKLNITLARARKGDAEKMVRRLRLELPLVFFALQREDLFHFLGFTDGTWFSMTSRTPRPAPANPGTEPARKVSPAVCSLRACEIYMRRTYAGKTKTLLGLLPDVLAGKRNPPPLDEKVKPGLGPELAVSKNPTGS